MDRATFAQRESGLSNETAIHPTRTSRDPRKNCDPVEFHAIDFGHVFASASARCPAPSYQSERPNARFCTRTRRALGYLPRSALTSGRSGSASTTSGRISALRCAASSDLPTGSNWAGSWGTTFCAATRAARGTRSVTLSPVLAKHPRSVFGVPPLLRRLECEFAFSRAVGTHDPVYARIRAPSMGARSSSLSR